MGVCLKMPSLHSLLSSGRLSWRNDLRHAPWAPNRCPLPKARVDAEPCLTAGYPRLRHPISQPWETKRSDLHWPASTLYTSLGKRIA